MERYIAFLGVVMLTTLTVFAVVILGGLILLMCGVVQ